MIKHLIVYKSELQLQLHFVTLQVTWVEHTEWQKSTIPAMYRSVVLGGQAFGARHWMATLQQQCERIVFCMATNVPTKDSNGDNSPPI